MLKRMKTPLRIAILLSLLIVSIPSTAGMLFSPPGASWTGILSRNTADVNGYLSMIEEARQGHYRMRNLFTAEPHEPFQIRPLWLLLGLAGRLLPALSVVHLMEAGRLLTSLVLLLVLASVARRLFETSRKQFIAFLVMTFGSGVGWMHLVKDPPDLRIVETSTFLTLISPPLYSLSLALLLSSLLLVEKSWTSPRGIRYGLLGGFCVLWLGFDRPFSLATLAFSIAGFLLTQALLEKKVNVRKLVRLLPFLVGALIPLLYHHFAIQNIAVYSEWNRQHILPTPPWANLITALGFMIPFAALGIRNAFRANAILASLFAFFISGSLLLSHLPFGFQERFLEGLPVLTAIFASFGLVTLLDRLRSPAAQTLVATLILVLLSLSHLVPLQNDFGAIARQSPPQYMPDRILASMRTLQSLSQPGEAILSTEPTGNFLIAYTGRPVVLGQKIQTARYFEKVRLVSEYFSTPADHPQSRNLFLKSQATWLFWGPEEAWKSLGRFQPSKADYLKEMHNDGFIRIFKLK